MERPEDPVKVLVSKPFIPPCLQKPAPQREKRRTDRIPAPPGKGFPPGCPEQSPRRRAPAPAVPRSRPRAEQLTLTHTHTHTLPSGLRELPRKKPRLCRSLGATVIYSETEQAAEEPRGKAGTAGPAGSSGEGGSEPSPLPGPGAPLRSVCGRRRRHFIIGDRGEKAASPNRRRAPADAATTTSPPAPPPHRPWLQRGLGWGGVCVCHRRGGSGEPAPGKLPGEVFTGGGRGMRQHVSHAGVGARDGERRPEAGGSSSEVTPLPGQRTQDPQRASHKAESGTGFGNFWYRVVLLSVCCLVGFLCCLFLIRFSFFVSSLSVVPPNPQAVGAESSCCTSFCLPPRASGVKQFGGSRFY